MTTYIEVFVYATLIFLWLAAGIYFTADRFKNLVWMAPVLATAGLITNTLTLAARSMLVGRLPLATAPSFFCVCLVLPSWAISSTKEKAEPTMPAGWQR